MGNKPGTKNIGVLETEDVKKSTGSQQVSYSQTWLGTYRNRALKISFPSTDNASSVLILQLA